MEFLGSATSLKYERLTSHVAMAIRFNFWIEEIDVKTSMVLAIAWQCASYDDFGATDQQQQTVGPAPLGIVSRAALPYT